MGNYLLKTAIDFWPDGWEDTRKDALIVKWEQIVERVTGDIFYEDTRTVLLDGNDKPRLALPNLPCLLSVTSLKIGDWELVASEYTFSTVELGLEVEETELEIEFPIFPRGFKNIELSGTFGWATTPEAIIDAVKILVEADIYPERHEFVDYVREVAGDMTQGKPIVRRLTGILEADRLLSHYCAKRVTMRRI